MHLDIVELRSFYARPLGAMVRRLLGQSIRQRWTPVAGSTLIGLGFATPYLGFYRNETLRLGALMSAHQGALVWPGSGAVHTVIVEEESLPLPDACVDRVLAVHCLDMAERPRPLLREIWRVLRPEGRLLVVVPNRRGVWPLLDTTPFGHGRPFSRGQLERLLGEALFTPLQWDTALFMPPLDNRFIVRWARAWERIGSRLWPAFGGVILVEAQKELMAPIAKPARARALPELVTVRGGAYSRHEEPTVFSALSETPHG